MRPGTVTSRPVALAVVVLLQLGLVGAATAQQLSARLLGEEYTFRVQPVDPIDPFRGAYVRLDYPDLELREQRWDDAPRAPGEQGELFLPLQRRGEVWVAGEPTRQRPADAPYLTCTDEHWRLSCGIESWFLPQDEARAMEQSLARQQLVAVVRIDGRGHAALVDVRAAG